MKKVWTPDGYKTGIQQSWVGKNESLIDYNRGKATLVDKGVFRADDQPSGVSENDNTVIAGNDIDWTNGRRFSEQIAPYTKLVEQINKSEKHREKSGNLSSLSRQTQKVQDSTKDILMSQMKSITDRQATQHEIKNYVNNQNMIYADKGKDLPKFDKADKKKNREYDPFSMSWAERAIPNILGATAALGKTYLWSKQPIEYRNTYSANPYENWALSTLANNRVNPRSAIDAALAKERAGAYALSQAGGLSGAQRYFGRVASGIANAQNLANIYFNTEEKNRELLNAWARAALESGAANAKRMQEANQYDYDTYMKAHGRRTAGIERGIADIVGQTQNWLANENKYKFNKAAASMYQQKLDNEQRQWVEQMQQQNDMYKAYIDATKANDNKVTFLPIYPWKMETPNYTFGDYKLGQLGSYNGRVTT